MEYVKPLPELLAKRFHGWKATAYEENRIRHRKLSDEGQHPRAMVISCCDSRVLATSIFEAGHGEFFMHRNIANLVPPLGRDGDCRGTAAAVEYAVTALGVPSLIVIGHSKCGGVKGCIDMCSGAAPELADGSSFVGAWLENLRPAYEKLSKIHDDLGSNPDLLAREGVLMSLGNLLTFPFVERAVAGGSLDLHGLFLDIREGVLEEYRNGAFVPV